MKKFGLIGGTSWHSTVDYYAQINRRVNEHHGDNTNPPLRMVSLNQKQIHDLQRANDWDGIAEIFVSAGLELQGLGVDGIAVCANTPHKVFAALSAALSVPVLHIADAMGETIRSAGLHTVGLIGTRFTMSQDFIKGRLLDRHQVKTVVPTDAEQDEIQRQIYQALSVGVFSEKTRAFFLQVIEALSAKGAQAVILGCTEFPLLLKDAHGTVPLIDSLKCHSEAITRFILDQDGLEQSAEGPA